MKTIYLKRGAIRRFSADLILALLFLASACHETSQDFLKAPQLAQATNWTEVFEKRTCTGSLPETICLGQNGFHMDTEGQASIGPDNGPVELGDLLTLEEINPVIDAANAVASQSLSNLLMTCEDWNPTPGEETVVVKLREEGENLKTVYQKSLITLQRCYRGNRGLAERLYEALHPLVLIHGVPVTPTVPTPTPTLSVVAED